MPTPSIVITPVRLGRWHKVLPEHLLPHLDRPCAEVALAVDRSHVSRLPMHRPRCERADIIRGIQCMVFVVARSGGNAFDIGPCTRMFCRLVLAVGFAWLPVVGEICSCRETLVVILTFQRFAVVVPITEWLTFFIDFRVVGITLHAAAINAGNCALRSRQPAAFWKNGGLTAATTQSDPVWFLEPLHAYPHTRLVWPLACCVDLD
mmetsp:Transcript_40030/g.105820  ORF Transcript_40030/g.105820 Transcript_40030/m.105820 type:complete len:206 (-) Transcript_40030:538-1155(-)